MSSSFGSKTTGLEVVQAFVDRLEGKTVLITGPSMSSIGGETVITLAHGNPSRIILAGRTESRATPVLAAIAALNPRVETSFIDVDLASQASVRAAAVSINASIDKIDFMINNAGITAVPTFETSEDGIELQFAANHVGPFLLTNLIIGKVLAAGKGARVANVASTGYELSGVRFEDWNFKDGQEYGPWLAYAQSKTANVLFAAGLAERLKKRGVLSFALQPGIVPGSNLAAHVTPEMWEDAMKIIYEATRGKTTELDPPKTLQEGCSTTLVAILDPSVEGANGGFLQDCQPKEINEEYAKGTENANKLWALSEKLVGQTFDWWW